MGAADMIAAAKAAREAAVAEQMNPVEVAVVTSRTFVHQSAGVNTIMPDGRRLTFAGRPGGFGYYSTDLDDEVTWMVALCKAPTSQVTELIEDRVNHTEKLAYKQVDPAVAAAAADAAKNSEAVFNPQASAAVEGLGNTIAVNAAANK